MGRFLRIVIEILILGTIVFMPMAFGGAPRWTWLVFELAVALAVILWMLRLVLERKLAYVKTPLNLLLVLLILYIFFQCVPIPAGLVKRLQPNTLRTYVLGPPPTTPDNRLLVGRATVPVSLNRWRTRDMLFLYMAYAGLFLLIVNNVNTRQQVGRLIGVVLTVGMLVTLAGLSTFKQDQRLMYRLFPVGAENERPWFLNPYAGPESSAGYGFVFQTKEGDRLPPRTDEEKTAYNKLSFDEQKTADARRKRLREKHGPDWYVPKVHGGDVYGGFQSSNSAASILGMTVLTGLGVFFAYISTRRSEWGKSGGFIYTREGNVTMLVFFLVALMLLAIALTCSRAGLGLLAVFLLLAIALNAFSRSLKAGLITLVVLAVVVVVPIVLVGWDRTTDYVDRQAAWHLNPWEDLRLLARQSTWHIIEDFPLFGTGLGTYGSIYPAYKIMGPMLYFAHCDPLQWMAETGLVGSILGGLILLTGLVTVIWGWLRLKDRFVKRLLVGSVLGCAFFLGHGWVDFPLAIPGVVVVFIAVASIAFVLARDRVASSEEQDFVF